LVRITTKNNTIVDKALQMATASDLVALDLETTGLDPHTSEIRLVQVSNGAETYVIDLRRRDVRPLVELLAEKTVVAHNAAFEWMFVYHHFGVELTDIRDTMLMAQLIASGDMSITCGLGPVAERELNVMLDKETQVSDWSLEPLTKRQLDYAAADAQVLLPLYGKLVCEISRLGLERRSYMSSEARHSDEVALVTITHSAKAGRPKPVRGRPRGLCSV
jgi:DNA polymerase I